jgi:hypothetical protein
MVVDAEALSVPVIEASIGDFLKRVSDVPRGQRFISGRI